MPNNKCLNKKSFNGIAWASMQLASHGAGAAEFWEGVVLQVDVLLPPSVSSFSADWIKPHASLTRDSTSAASGQRKHSRKELRR